MSEFKVGDVVRVANSKAMTVERVCSDVNEDGHDVFCVWFDGETLMRSGFASPTVSLFVPPEAP
jgi:uncharacterized protein YodC (DUF2158 family)